MSMFHSSCKREQIKKGIAKRGFHVCFYGICGSGMSALARLIKSFGATVYGVDRDYQLDIANSLRTEGICVYSEENGIMKGTDAVVYSLAVEENSRIITEAREKKIPYYSRAQLLGALIEDYESNICVSGTHGKSTVSAMLGTVFLGAGFCPTVVCGASLGIGKDNLIIGENKIIIAEACEYKDSFLHFPSKCLIINSVEHDHPDYFPTLKDVKCSFIKAANNAEDMVVISCDTPASREIIPEIKNRVYTYGAENADFVYEIKSVSENGIAFLVAGEKYYLSLKGRYNVSNATGVVATAKAYGIPYKVIYDSLSSFRTISRRMEYLGKLKARSVYYDYAHHPTEIRANIEALKELYSECTVLFRPHTVSRTESLWGEFVDALRVADYSLIFDIYLAREDEREGIDSKGLSDAVGRGSYYVTEDSAFEILCEKTSGPIILMGAGNLDYIKGEIMNNADFCK